MENICRKSLNFVYMAYSIVGLLHFLPTQRRKVFYKSILEAPLDSWNIMEPTMKCTMNTLMNDIWYTIFNWLANGHNFMWLYLSIIKITINLNVQSVLLSRFNATNSIFISTSIYWQKHVQIVTHNRDII